MTVFTPPTARPAVRSVGRPTDAGPRTAGARRRRLQTAAVVVGFLAPSAIPLLLFVYAPMVRAGWISLHKWNLISPMKWVGLRNYTDLLTDPSTGAVFGHTVEYVVGYLPLVLVGGLALALALNQPLRGRNVLRGVYFLPVITSWIAVALVWRWLLNPSVGVDGASR